jgi:hypothetical protein
MSYCNSGISDRPRFALHTWNKKRKQLQHTKQNTDLHKMISPHALATTAVMLWSCKTCVAFLSPTLQYSTFSSPSLSSSRPSSTTRLEVSNGSPDAPKTIEEDAALQWGMFTRHHALDGEWWGTWSTYNYMGDLEDSTVAGLVACAMFIFAIVWNLMCRSRRDAYKLESSLENFGLGMHMFHTIGTSNVIAWPFFIAFSLLLVSLHACYLSLKRITSTRRRFRFCHSHSSNTLFFDPIGL